MKIRKKSLNKKNAYTSRIPPKIYRRHQALPPRTNRSYITPMISQAQKSKLKLYERIDALVDVYGGWESDDNIEYESFNDSRMQNPLKRTLMRSNSIVMPQQPLPVNDVRYGAAARRAFDSTNYPQLHNGRRAVHPKDLGIDYSEYNNVQPLPTIEE